MSKVPKGTTHTWVKGVSGSCVNYKRIGLVWYYFSSAKVWNESRKGEKWCEHNLTPITSWSIYNNTKPLRELPDEHAAELFNHARHGGVIEATYGHSNIDVSNYTWFPDAVYRAKQKTELELFIEDAKATGGGLTPSEFNLVTAMYNVGFTRPKDTK